jgi:uncharacterized protein YbjT (DUF2867 family)
VNSERRQRIAIFGATGLAGSGVLRACLADPEVAEIVALTRRPLDCAGPKLREIHVENFNDLSPLTSELKNVDACFYCLGIASSGVSEAQYRVITKDYVLEAARVLKSASPKHTLHFVSGGSTNINSRFMWARVKGETEEALKTFGLAGIVCWRPGMILGDRPPQHLSPSARAIYPLLRLMRFIPPLAVEAVAIGEAMLQLEFEGQQEGTLENSEIRAAAARYQRRSHQGGDAHPTFETSLA